MKYNMDKGDSNSSSLRIQGPLSKTGFDP